jgi:hypothetical protein
MGGREWGGFVCRVLSLLLSLQQVGRTHTKS